MSQKLRPVPMKARPMYLFTSTSTNHGHWLVVSWSKRNTAPRPNVPPSSHFDSNFLCTPSFRPIMPEPCVYGVRLPSARSAGRFRVSPPSSTSAKNGVDGLSGGHVFPEALDADEGDCALFALAPFALLTPAAPFGLLRAF